MSIATAARRYVADIARAFDRAPVECALTVAAAALLSWVIEDGDIATEAARTIVAMLLILAAAWAGTLLHALRELSDRRRWALAIAGTVVAAGYLLLTSDFEHGSEGWRAFMLLAGAVLLVFAAPSLRSTQDESNLRLRRSNSRFVLRAVGITLYGLALFAGLAVAIAAVDNLFELKLDEKLYMHVWVWIMVVLVPWVVIGGLDDYVQPLDRQSDVARVVYRLTTYLVPPLVALYFIILLLYVVRIGVTGELPKNLVSPMVIAAGLLSALALIMFDPRPDTAPGLRWLRFTPLVFLPLVPLGIWALAARIDEYGWTEFRILRVAVLIVLCLLALAAVLPVLRRRTLVLRAIPLALGVVLILGAVGPWSVLSIARRSQQERLRSALAEANIDVSAPRAPGDTATRIIPGPVYRRLHGSATYLQSHFGRDAVHEIARNLPPGEDAYMIADYYGVISADPVIDGTRSMTLFGSIPSHRAFQTPDGQVYRINVSAPPERPVPSPAAGQPSPAAGQPLIRGTLLVVPFGGDTLRVELATVAVRVIAMNVTNDGRRRDGLPPDQVVQQAVDAKGAVRGYLVVLEIAVTTEDTAPRITRLDGLLTVH